MIAIALPVLVAACFGDPPGVDSAGAESSDESESESSSGGADTSDAMCQNVEPPPGCTELLHNNGFDDWATSLPFPTEWQLDQGTATRVDDGEAECPPAMRVHAGAPIDDGHVWTLGQTVSAPAIEIGGRAVLVVPALIASPRMINGAHVIIYSTDAEADRNFLKDVLGLPHVDVGHGWLIFGLPPAEVAVHPGDEGNTHELYLMVENVETFVAKMSDRGIICAPVQNLGWGLLTKLTLPGGSKLGVYEPRHARPPSA